MKTYKASALVIIPTLLLIAGLHFFLPHDSTDNPDGGRSGLILYTDHLTGCQYIKAGYFSTLVPRMALVSGRGYTHVCGTYIEYIHN